MHQHQNVALVELPPALTPTHIMDKVVNIVYRRVAPIPELHNSRHSCHMNEALLTIYSIYAANNTTL